MKNWARFIPKKEIQLVSNLNGSYLPIFDGNHNDEANASTFYFNCNNSASNSNSNIGTHLLYQTLMNPALPLGKTSKVFKSVLVSTTEDSEGIKAA